MRTFAAEIAGIMAAVIGLAGGPAVACTVYTPPQLASAAEADLVFVGELQEVVTYGWEGVIPGISLPYGQYTFSVTETLKGDHQPEREILWWVNVMASNTRIDPEKAVIVFAMDGKAIIQALVEAGVLGPQYLETPRYIIEEPICSSAPIFENSLENRVALERLLSTIPEGN